MRIKAYQWHEYISLAVKQIGKPCVYISNHLEYNQEDKHVWGYVIQEMKKLFPGGTETEVRWENVVCDLMFNPLIEFDTEEEAWEFYQIFNVRGKTYASPIFATVFSSDGELLSENT
jgi:hypothetical protein